MPISQSPMIMKAASPLQEHLRRRVIVASGDRRIHVFGDHRAILLERLDHLGASHRRRIAFDERLLEKIDILAVDDDFEGRRVRPVGAEMGEADHFGGDRFVAGGVEFGPGLRQLLDAGLGHALLEPQIQLMRWMFIGAATHLPVGFMTGSSSGATTFSQPSSFACASRSAVMPVAFHSAISGPLSCTAGGALPAITSARSLASVLAVWPAMEVCSHLPPALGEHLAELGDGRGVGAASPIDAACWSSARQALRSRSGRGRKGPRSPRRIRT